MNIMKKTKNSNEIRQEKMHMNSIEDDFKEKYEYIDVKDVGMFYYQNSFGNWSNG